MRFGLLGNHLSHSYSPRIHRYFGNYSYELFENEPENLEAFLKSGDFKGINVTAPYKKAVIPYCRSLSQSAQRLGAVNTIIRDADGNLTGHNTDYFGFSYMLHKSGLSVSGKKVLILGSGGAAAAVLGVLKDAGADVLIVSRTGENNYRNLARHSDARVIVNATPVGMYPHTGECPVSLQQFPALEGVLDVIYNPARTELLLEAEALGIPICNGLWMLIAQAKEAAEWFTSSAIPDSVIETVYRQLSASLQNLVLIGMPGCGKTTVGLALSQLTGRPFLDTDSLIEAQAGKTLPQIFREDGEEAFRELESQVLMKVSKESGLIIATGGGCVCRPENYAPLHQNSRIVWLQRNIHQLPTDGRPLSAGKDLKQMYENRKALYAHFADCIVCNDGTPENTAKYIAAAEDSL